MAQINTFRAIRPVKELTERFAALPYDVYNREEAKAEVCREPLSFLRIDRPETLLPGIGDIYDPQVYQKARDVLWDLIRKKDLVQDEKEAYYVYELTMNGRSQTGLVACASVDDYVNGVIMKHENTRADKEQDRIRHVDACDAQTGPIFLAYRSNDVIRECLERAKENTALFDYTSCDGITHRGWMIAQEDQICLIRDAFAGIQKIYIADGHHRAASAVKVSLMRRETAAAAGKDPSAVHEYDRFLSVLFAEDELCIMDYNRVVKDLNGYTPKAFLERLSEDYEIRETGSRGEPVRPVRKHQMGMYLRGRWYCLDHKGTIPEKDPVGRLDVSLLQETLLGPVLGIGDPKTDNRILFSGGIRGLNALEKTADETDGVAFAMYPTSMTDLFDVADAHLLMPPKSTWFEPKLRSGLFIHALSENI